MIGNLRADRIVTLRVVEPVRRLLRTKLTDRIPILMYHEVSSERKRRHPYFETNTSSETFTAQMRFLKKLGYRTVSITEAVKLLQRNEAPPRTVVITFDDGLRSFYTCAIPVLLECDLKATVFVIAGVTDGRPHNFQNAAFMTWDQVRKAADLGMEIGSHTVSHRKLHLLSEAAVRGELEESRSMIEDELGQRITTLSYPYAFPQQDRTFQRCLKQVAKQVGYAYGVTTVLGSAHKASDSYFLPRIPVNEFDDLELFEAKLVGAYDWLHTPQSLYKKLGRIRGNAKR